MFCVSLINALICCCLQSPEREFLIRVSYLEIYQENVVDLLGNLAKHLDIKENYVSEVCGNHCSQTIQTLQIIYNCLNVSIPTSDLLAKCYVISIAKKCLV